MLAKTYSEQSHYGGNIRRLGVKAAHPVTGMSMLSHSSKPQTSTTNGCGADEDTDD